MDCIINKTILKLHNKNFKNIHYKLYYRMISRSQFIKSLKDIKIAKKNINIESYNQIEYILHIIM